METLFLFTVCTNRWENFYSCFTNCVNADVSDPPIQVNTKTLQLLYSETPVRRKRVNEAVENLSTKHAIEKKKMPDKPQSLEIQSKF